jgi:D-alanine--poly(phosphoribitol) ligase subunit 2
MTDVRARVGDAVRAAAAELNPSLEEPIDLAAGDDAQLYGGDGPLDSLALVTLTSTVEQLLDDELGITVSLTDERALSQARSPFRTVGSLADFAATLLDPVAAAD